MSGRTEWLPKDVAWHRRGRVVALGQRHGGAAVNALDWLMCEAFPQNPLREGTGEIKTGYAAVAHGAFLASIDDAREVVATCVELGLLDDFHESDKWTFEARISGWHQDVNLTLEASRKAVQRGAKKPGTTVDNGGHPGTTAVDVPECPETSPTRQDKTEENSRTTSSELAKASPEALHLSRLLADLILQRDPKAKVAPDSERWLTATRLLLADRDGDALEVERVLRWSQADSFWQANILSPSKLRERFTQLTVKMKAAPIRQAAETAAPTRWADRAAEWAAEDAAKQAAA